MLTDLEAQYPDLGRPFLPGWCNLDVKPSAVRVVHHVACAARSRRVPEGNRVKSETRPEQAGDVVDNRPVRGQLSHRPEKGLRRRPCGFRNLPVVVVQKADEFVADWIAGHRCGLPLACFVPLIPVSAAVRVFLSNDRKAVAPGQARVRKMPSSGFVHPRLGRAREWKNGRRTQHGGVLIRSQQDGPHLGHGEVDAEEVVHRPRLDHHLLFPAGNRRGRHAQPLRQLLRLQTQRLSPRPDPARASAG